MKAAQRRLGEVCALNPALPHRVGRDTLVTFVPMPAVDADTGTIRGAEIRQAGEVWSQPAFIEDDVLFAKITPSLQNGKHAVARNLTNGIGFGSTEFHILRPSSMVLPDWVHQFLRRAEVAALAERRLIGSAGQQRVPASFLADLLIPVPELQTQRLILEALRGELESIRIARAAIATRAVTSRALGTALRRRAFPTGPLITRGRRTIASLAHVQSGYAFRSESFRNAGIRLLRNANVRHRSIDWSDAVYLDPAMQPQFERYQLFEGDLILSLDRPIVASGLKVARLTSGDVPSLLLQRVARLIPGPEIDRDYLFEFMLSDEFTDAVSGHDQSLGVPHISPKLVGRIELPFLSLPSQRGVARELRDQIETIDAMEASICIEREAIEALSAATLRRAFDEVAA